MTQAVGRNVTLVSLAEIVVDIHRVGLKFDVFRLYGHHLS